MNSTQDNILEIINHFDITKDDKDTLFCLCDYFGLSLLDVMTIADLYELGEFYNNATILYLLCLMFSAMRQGSLCLNIEINELTNVIKDPLGNKKAYEIAKKILDEHENNAFNKIISQNNDISYPLISHIINGKNLCYFQKYFICEKNLKDYIENFLSADLTTEICEDKIDIILDEIYSNDLSLRVENEKDSRPIIKDAYHLNAIKLVLETQFSIISGGPGTGKTSLVVNLLRSFVRAGLSIEDIILCAPTGRAAQKISEAIATNINSIKNLTPIDKELVDIKAGTLHSILKYKNNINDFYFNNLNQLNASVVIVDEASMVDVIMLDKLFKAINPCKTKIIILGDKDQLPSVDAGAILSEMITKQGAQDKFKNNLVMLKNVYRSDKQLVDFAKLINKGIYHKIDPISFESALLIKKNNHAFVEIKSKQNLQNNLLLWVKKYYLKASSNEQYSYIEHINMAKNLDFKKQNFLHEYKNCLESLFNLIEKNKILTVARYDTYGCVNLNSNISKILQSKTESFSEQNDIFSGSLIMITRNDYKKNLFNGDIGIVLKDKNGQYLAFFKRGDTYIYYLLNTLYAWELAFAITVHKSQGSEFNDIMLVLPENEKHKLLTREIIYTAITRAKEKVIIYGSNKAYKRAIENKINRQSGFYW